MQLADFAEWQRSRLTDDVLAGELAYWTRELAAVPTVLDLPTDRRASADRESRGRQTAARAAGAIDGGARGAAPEPRARPSSTASSPLFQILIHRYTGQEDFVVGVPVDDRVRPELEETVGVLLSTAVVRSDLEGMPTFRELLPPSPGSVCSASPSMRISPSSCSSASSSRSVT